LTPSENYEKLDPSQINILLAVLRHSHGMTRASLIISTLLVPIDYAMLLSAAVLAYALRFRPFAELRPVQFNLPLNAYIELAALVAAGWILIFALSGLYATTTRRRWTSELARIFLATSTGFAGILATIVFSRELFDSRFIILASWPLAIVTVVAGRLMVRGVERILFARGIGAHRVILIGNGRSADALAGALAARPALGFRIVHRFETFSDATAKRIRTHWSANEFDELIDAEAAQSHDQLAALLDFAAFHHIPVRYAADLVATHSTRVGVETFAGVPLIEPKPTPLEGWGRIAKRAFDLFVSMFLLVLLAPVMLVIAIAIRFDTPGTILFRQSRTGAAGRTFTFLKFRSMVEGAHDQWGKLRAESDRDGIIPKIKHDPRVTHVGRFLRRWSLDELPQLFNVFTGSMSLVGPRPHLPEEVADYLAHHRKVLAIRPGMTGLAQVSGRADLDFEDEVRLDALYIEHWSFARDLVILLRTPFAVLRARGAY
jgi:exopolysaccharide biosynthesis polyprenyl glycosylphosphotransferase